MKIFCNSCDSVDVLFQKNLVYKVPAQEQFPQKHKSRASLFLSQFSRELPFTDERPTEPHIDCATCMSGRLRGICVTSVKCVMF